MRVHPRRSRRPEATAFERWLETAPLHADPATAKVHRSRLRDFYAKSPAEAIAIARDHHGYPAGPSLAAPRATDPDAAAARAHDYADNADNVGTRLGESDFAAMTRAGYEYDPVSRQFRPGRATTRTGVPVDVNLVTSVNQVIGQPLHSRAIGDAVMTKLAMGEIEALRLVGVEPPRDFDSRWTEWGLGLRQSDKAIVLVRGEGMQVDWAKIPGVEELGHSHPYSESKYFQVGGQRDGSVHFDDVVSGKRAGELQRVVPSGSDFVYIAERGLAVHDVYLPYVHLGGKMIGNPRPGAAHDVVRCTIRDATIVGSDPKTSAPIVKAELVVRAGEETIWRGEVHASSVGNYMPVWFHEPPMVRGAPPARPGSGVTRSPLQPIPAELTQRLGSIGVDLLRNPPVFDLVHRLDLQARGWLHALVEHQTAGRVKGLDRWLSFVADKDGADLVRTSRELREALRLVGEQKTGLIVGIGGEVNAPMNPKKPKERLGANDLWLEDAKGEVKASIDSKVRTVTRYPSGGVRSPSDLTPSITEAATTIKNRAAAGLPVPGEKAAIIEAPLDAGRRLHKGGERDIAPTGEITFFVKGKQLGQPYNFFDRVLAHLPEVEHARWLDRITLVDRAGQVGAEYYKDNGTWTRVR